MNDGKAIPILGWFGLVLILLATQAVPTAAAELKPEANRGFDDYVSKVEGRLQRQHSSVERFVQFTGSHAEGLSELQGGKFVIEDLGRDFPKTPGAMMHHWRGSAFVPGASTSDFLRLMQDYNSMYQHYQPQMLWSKLLSHDGNSFRVAMRLRQHKVITVVTDSEYDVHYGALDRTHGYSISRSTSVSEISNVGSKSEHALPPDQAHGFLWRINTYWTYAEMNGGLVIQCESVSITRDIPRGLGWIVGPFVQSVPKESLDFTLRSSRKALESQVATRQSTQRGSR